jgi:hypothetical protein
VQPSEVGSGVLKLLLAVLQVQTSASHCHSHILFVLVTGRVHSCELHSLL